MNIHQACIQETNFQLPGQTAFYRGKVRDVYTVGEELIMVASDRISAFDHILPRAIPFKGQVLNQIAAYFLNATRDIVPNWLIDTPDPNVAVGHACNPFKVEMVIRGYLAGHAWREYKAGKRIICGVPMPDGMKETILFPHQSSHQRPKQKKAMMKISQKKKSSARVLYQQKIMPYSNNIPRLCSARHRNGSTARPYTCRHQI
jgi:phosphoribosylaminoimidazole-succinocarboxamide synthase